MLTNIHIMPPRDCSDFCVMKFSLSLSLFGICNWPEFRGWQVSLSISHQIQLQHSLQDPGRDKGSEKASLRLIIAEW